MIDLVPPRNVGEPIPKAEIHGVSVTLPTWKANVAYELGEHWVTSKIKSGYPRFCVHWRILELQDRLIEKYGMEGEVCVIFGSYNAALRARDFVNRRATEEVSDSTAKNAPFGSSTSGKLRIVRLSTRKTQESPVAARISVLFYPKDLQPVIKEYWQHTGEGISSRLAEYFLCKSQGIFDFETKYVEERFGRNLDLSFAEQAKQALRKRIAQQTSENSIVVQPQHVYLYGTGMTAIFSAHMLIQRIANSKGEGLKTICFGFPYTDTLKLLQKWGPGCQFYPFGNEQEIEDLERRLQDGERFAALFCEFPSNPLLNSPNIIRLRKLADKYGFYIAVDNTVGNILNVDVMPYADLTMASLTKIFSGDANVMGGEITLNPRGTNFSLLQTNLDEQYDDAFWAEDAIYLERNSRDFIDRNRRTDENARAIVNVLSKSDIVKQVYYPSLSASKSNYDALKVGGYGGLLSVVFQDPNMSPVFFDTLNIAKGPSLGTNFTLACPYAIIAHFNELDFVEECGVPRNIVRVSIGLEDTSDLIKRFENALAKAAEANTENEIPAE